MAHNVVPPGVRPEPLARTWGVRRTTAEYDTLRRLVLERDAWRRLARRWRAISVALVTVLVVLCCWTALARGVLPSP